MACELLLTDNRQKAVHLAKALCRLNNRRQSMEKDLLELILDRLARRPGLVDRPVLVVDGNCWHEGILGIVASHLTRRFNRPAVVISTRNGVGKGSARSIDGIDLSAALNRCADLLGRFGGHPLAAGLSLPTANIAAFRTRLESVVGQIAADRDGKPTLSIDAHLPLDDITPELMNSLDRLEPFGQGNPYPLFMDTRVRVHACKTVGDRHRQMVLESKSGKGRKHPAIQFNVTGVPLKMDQLKKIAYRPQWNYWNGKKNLQILVEETDPGS
jgi:single-stranded-DNA-specific exonuclease